MGEINKWPQGMEEINILWKTRLKYNINIEVNISSLSFRKHKVSSTFEIQNGQEKSAGPLRYLMVAV